MSLYERIVPIYLHPRPGLISSIPKTRWDYVRLLLYWSYFNPLEIQGFVEHSLLPPKQEATRLNVPWVIENRWERLQRSMQFDWLHALPDICRYLRNVATLVLSILLYIEVILFIITSNLGLSLEETLRNFIVSLVIGIVAIVFFLFIGIYSGEFGIFALWAIYFGLGYPLLYLFEMWVKSPALQGESWILLLFAIFCGTFFGAMLNNITSIFTRRISHSASIYILALLPIISFIGTVILYFGQFNTTFGTTTTIFSVVAAIGVAVLAFLRIDDCLIAQLRLPKLHAIIEARDELNGSVARQLYEQIPRVTYIAPPRLTQLLPLWLQQDWDQGLENFKHLWTYTNLQFYVLWYIQNALKTTAPTELLKKIDQTVSIIERKTSDRLTFYRPMVNDQGVGHQRWVQLGPPIEDLLHLQIFHNRSFSSIIAQILRRQQHGRKDRSSQNRLLQFQIARFTDNHRNFSFNQPTAPWQNALIACIHLREHQLERAHEAFAQLPGDYAKEMSDLCRGLDTLLKTERQLEGPKVQLPTRPQIPNHSESWDALDLFAETLRKAWLYSGCPDDRKPNLELEIRQNITKLGKWGAPHPETSAIQRLAELWSIDLKAWFQSNRTQGFQKIYNPYIYKEMLYRSKTFVGRQRLLRILAEENQRDNLRPVILHGLPKVGKSSLLYQFANRSGQAVTLLYIHVPQVANTNNPLRSLVALILRRLQDEVNGEASADTDIERQMGRQPLHFMHQQIEWVCKRLNRRILLLALDDFDQLNLHNDPKEMGGIVPHSQAGISMFIDQLQEMYATISNFNVVITLQQPMAQLQKQKPWARHEFLQSAREERVKNLTRDESARLLHAPITEHAPRLLQQGISRAYQYTAGQPFLLQLLGYCLLERYNQAVAIKTQTSPIFDGNNDILAVVSTDNEFRNQKDRYFQQMMAHLNRSLPRSGLVLWSIAQYTGNTTVGVLRQSIPQTVVSHSMLGECLAFLTASEVIRQYPGQFRAHSYWIIPSTLLATWLQSQPPPQ